MTSNFFSKNIHSDNNINGFYIKLIIFFFSSTFGLPVDDGWLSDFASSL